MVVSKDSKRKRKESPPPQPSAVESSPEMPKRTKVQAQRKFAQGQSAPPSSYNSITAASSSSNTGPSTSSESRDPPTEILPNKRPKTEDFLTFLCFRGTPALPAHLDFLNQGKGKESETPAIKKNVTKTAKTNKKGKKGRPKAVAKTDEPKASTSSGAPEAVNEKNEVDDTTNLNKNKEKPVDEKVMPFAVRKRAEVVTEGNRRGRPAGDRQLRNAADTEKCNSLPEAKRRSNRSNAKESKPSAGAETDEDDECLSTNDETCKVAVSEKRATPKIDSKKSKTPIPERKSETPSKESETGKSRRGRPASTTKKNQDILKENASDANKMKETAKSTHKSEVLASEQIQPSVKEKAPVKRPRHKESPIFIPSPEPSGRMTRQRAFFEPVKVPHREENDEEEKTEGVAREKPCETINLKTMNDNTRTDSKESNILKNTRKSVKKDNDDQNVESNEEKKNLNVFDFSSDDEQPLAKSIKMKKTVKGSPRKNTSRSNKAGRKSPKKTQGVKEENKNTLTSKEEEVEELKQSEPEKIGNKTENENENEVEQEKQDDISKMKNKRGKNVRKKVDESAEEDKELAPPSPKKASNVRQSRKKTIKSDNVAVNGEEEKDKDFSPSAPIRNQRPTRKTKEAATIYMGIIGHKLQLADDEDDDLSLNSFPDRPNVKEMEKMEIELKKNATHAVTTGKATTVSPAVNKTSPKQATELSVTVEKPTGRRGRPPKQAKQPPVKREIEGMLVKKGAITKLVAPVDSAQNKEKPESSKVETDDEDFLLNEEVNETKRKLEKSFSDSDDEPLAIKASVRPNEKEVEKDAKKCETVTQSSTSTPQLVMLPLTAKPVPTPPLNSTHTTSASPVTGTVPNVTSQVPSPFKTIEKKSPVPTSKILNVPATYAMPSANAAAGNVNVTLNSNFNKTSPYLPQASPLYHSSHVRPMSHQFPTAKSPTGPPGPSVGTTVSPHLNAPPPPQSPLKYQAAPTTYPPPIEAYPSPKINPNFLTPKFDRASLPRANNFPSPSPLKYDMSSTVSKAGLITSSALSAKTTTIGGSTMAVSIAATTTASTSAAVTGVGGGSGSGPGPGSGPGTGTGTGTGAAIATVTASASAVNSNDPLKDEIGSILAANLMPSKEESGKIFGIASVSLAQSSGPDNTKCTLGKCGSIHKPVLGPVVPTEGYIGDQLSSKERRKAKVNMTHEQIQKWLIECSSNPDEIQDDLDDDYDDNLRPNLYATTPPPTRDDKESTSFSSSSKATRDLGKSESAWSAKGPSLKATPVVATASRKEDGKQPEASTQPDMTSDNERNSGQAINLTQKAAVKQNTNVNSDLKTTRSEKSEKKVDKKLKDDKPVAKEHAKGDNKQNKIDKEKDGPASGMTSKTAVTSKQPNTTADQSQLSSEPITTSTSKQNRKKNVMAAATPEDKSATSVANKSAVSAAPNISSTASKTPKRTPVYNQKVLQKQVELKETTTSSHKKVTQYSYGAFSADNEKSIYSFDKDDDEANGSKPMTKPAFRRQSQRDSQQDEVIAPTTPTSRASSAKKRSAAVAAEKANKDLANSSVSLTLSPSENKLVKVSLDAEKSAVTTKTPNSKSTKAAKKTDVAKNNDADSDSDGHTFYIPLQGSGTGGDGEGGIQGVAVKLGREGPDGPNQKVIMHATLVTKAQMGSNSKPLPDSMNVSDIVKTLMTTSQNQAAANVSTNEGPKKGDSKSVTASTSAAAAASAASSSVAAANSGSNSLKNVPIGTVQPRFKGTDPATANNQSTTPVTVTATAAGAGTTAAVVAATIATGAGTGTGSGTVTSSGLVRVNSSSSLISSSAKSRVGTSGPGPSGHGVSKKFKDDTPIKMSNNTAFPRHDDPTQMVDAPIFRPTEKEFADPIDFIERITPIAARFGICKIIPPSTFKPECRISDEMRFTAYNQYVHKMLHRWGPSAKELSAIKKYLATQSIMMNHPPWIGGMEVDLPRLYHTVQELGGLKEVIEKKKWARVAEEMCIPKLAQDRVTKLDDIYCKYLLPYDTLSPAERQKLFDEVEADWAKREARARRNADRFVNTESVSNEEDDVSSEDDEESEEEVDGVSMECIVKGRSMPLSQFYRIARNTMALWFKNTEPTVNEVEAEFWRHVAVRDSHVCVHSGSIDSSGWGYGFPSPGPKGKGSNYARHPWNLKVLTNNPSSVLRSLGPVMGVTVPTLHVGMLFSACCWYRDPHGLSWIEYLHTGASKLWYGIPDDQSSNFRAALTSLIPTHCQNKTIWLPCDTVMVPPHMLTDRGVSLCRIEQKPGEFIVVFPRAYTSSLATGYVVSESVYFATSSWLDSAKDDFRDIHDSCEPAMFSLEQLLFALGYDQRVSPDTLQQMLPMLHEVFEKETAAREQLKAAGVTSTEKVHNEKGSKAKKQQPPFKSIETECDLCRANLYISMVRTEEGNVYCLQHALKNLNNGNIQAKQCKLIYAYNVEDIENLIKNLKEKIQQKRSTVANKKSK